MPDKVVEVPGVGNVSFPDSMSDEDISTAIQAQLGQKTGPAPSDVGQQLIGGGKAFWEGMGGGMIPKLWHMATGAMPGSEGHEQAVQDLSDIVSGIRDIPARTQAEWQKGGEALVRGDIPTYLRQTARGVPLFGEPVTTGEEQLERGQWGPGIGNIGAAIMQGAAPEVVARLKQIPIIRQGGILPKANPLIQNALDYLESKGVPVPLAARTDAPGVKYAQKIVDVSPIGSYISSNEGRLTTDALKSEAQNLINRATPPTPADPLYAAFRQAEADPANLVQVQTGTSVSPQARAALDAEALKQFKQGFGGLDPVQKQAVRTAVADAGIDLTPAAVNEKIPMAVNVGALKPRLKPIFDEMQWMPAADRNTSPGYTAIKNILDGPDYIPASQAELGLSGLKAMARNAQGRSAGIAKFVMGDLQNMIDTAAANAGPDVKNALQEARVAAAREMGADWLQKTLVGKAQEMGDMGRAQGIFRDWQNLNASDKLTMFRDPKLVSDIDKFMLGFKRLSENPNPSGSGILWAVGQSGLALQHPTTGLPVILGQGALSKLMHSRAGVNALMNGLQLSVSPTAATKVARAAAASRILALAGSDVHPLQESDWSPPQGAPAKEPIWQQFQVAPAR